MCGTFRVPKKDPLNPPSPFHRWLVCVVHFPDEVDAIGRPALVPRAVSPFGSRVLLADDEVEHQGHVEGSFGLDVLALLHHGSRSRIPDDEARRQPFTVSAVLGVHTSNALDVDVR